MLRHAANVVKGYRTQDGAGVSLVRVLGDQTAGFPLHPHRGIETVSYLREGAMHHRDTMGFEDTVTSGEVQWMCAGSGVEHEETIPAARRLLGVQLWLNLPAAEKMVQPTYHAVKRDAIESVPLDGAVLRLLAGRYVDENGKSHQGFVGSHLPLDYYELTVEAGHSVEIPVDEDRSVLAFTLEGPALIGGLPLGEKTAVKLVEGDRVGITATDEKPSVVLLMSSVALREPIAWGGPIVMNSTAELRQAFRDLDEGTFIREDVRSL